MVKRTVVNIIYQDSPQWLYDNRKQPFVSDAGFDLEYRVRGEDVPRVAHTMYVGWAAPLPVTSASLTHEPLSPRASLQDRSRAPEQRAAAHHGT